jgi:hypothetical protein
LNRNIKTRTSNNVRTDTAETRVPSWATTDRRKNQWMHWDAITDATIRAYAQMISSRFEPWLGEP